MNIAARRNSLFTWEHDVQVVKWATQIARSSNKSLLALNPSKLSLSSQHAMTFGKLAGMSADALRIRFAVLALFNQCVPLPRCDASPRVHVRC